MYRKLLVPLVAVALGLFVAGCKKDPPAPKIKEGQNVPHLEKMTPGGVPGAPGAPAGQPGKGPAKAGSGSV